jgi:hypothetical protein
VTSWEEVIPGTFWEQDWGTWLVHELGVPGQDGDSESTVSTCATSSLYGRHGGSVVFNVWTGGTVGRNQIVVDNLVVWIISEHTVVLGVQVGSVGWVLVVSGSSIGRNLSDENEGNNDSEESKDEENDFSKSNLFVVDFHKFGSVRQEEGGSNHDNGVTEDEEGEESEQEYWPVETTGYTCAGSLIQISEAVVSFPVVSGVRL